MSQYFWVFTADFLWRDPAEHAGTSEWLGSASGWVLGGASGWRHLCFPEETQWVWRIQTSHLQRLLQTSLLPGKWGLWINKEVLHVATWVYHLRVCPFDLPFSLYLCKLDYRSTQVKNPGEGIAQIFAWRIKAFLVCVYELDDRDTTLTNNLLIMYVAFMMCYVTSATFLYLLFL